MLVWRRRACSHSVRTYSTPSLRTSAETLHNIMPIQHSSPVTGRRRLKRVFTSARSLFTTPIIQSEGKLLARTMRTSPHLRILLRSLCIIAERRHTDDSHLDWLHLVPPHTLHRLEYACV
ncbi:hypothetical protein L227DRAFT_348365 [Lentinus tigrinus ALCF2SS1-6]|uniref:Uncharacterized protein n=1 Tax=Lentinus tigrinus ALCF2SS1-6 TaxID=1328759 RepID=A0A5C2RW33_9APHY|nr:hypothetical protein L227DRAFT_348365 [Lentinus tigrinus ALCF2SS1-6]